MQARLKIRCDAVERARKLLETVTTPTVEEVTKSEAVRMLLPQICEARSKGYSLEAIAKMLSESGVTASASLVRDLLTEANASLVSGLDARSKSARLRKSPVREVRAHPRHEPSSGALDSKTAPEVTRAANPDRSIRPEGTGDGATPVVKSPSVGQPVVRRSTFVPRPDTENI
jgi:DNA-binding transcriptional MerR regulator